LSKNNINEGIAKYHCALRKNIEGIGKYHCALRKNIEGIGKITQNIRDSRKILKALKNIIAL